MALDRFSARFPGFCRDIARSTVARSLLVYLVIPNLLFYVLGRFVYLMRPAVNVDYLVVGALAAWLGGFVSALLFWVFLANEILVNVAPIYHFQVIDAFQWLSNMVYVSWRYWVPIIVGLLAASFALSWWATRWVERGSGKRRKTTAVLLLGICLSVSSADIANGTSFLAVPFHLSFANFNVAYSGARRSALSLMALESRNARLAFEPLPPAGSASGELLEHLAKSPARRSRRQIALVVVESMSLFRDPALRKSLLAPLLSPEIAKRYKVEVGSVPFTGHTIDGEFRELCGVKLLGYGEVGFPKCLPELLHERGYETTALHGFTNQFYDRFRWYPKLGFDRMLFAEDMQRLGVKDKCGSGFKGICDVSVAELLHRHLLKGTRDAPQFVYWMTLNSHLPLDSKSALDSTFDCRASAATRNDPAICTHSRMVHLVLEKLAQIALDPELPRTELVVVGDHMAPFIRRERRALYSDTEVPSIRLEPVIRAERASSRAGR